MRVEKLRFLGRAAGVLACMLAGHATQATATDLAVESVQLVQIGGQWGVEVSASISMGSAQADFDFNLTIEHIRNDVVVDTPVDDDIPIVNAENCENCATSCYGTCSFIISSQRKTGSCIIGGQCDTDQTKKKCTCNVGGIWWEPISTPWSGDATASS